MGDKEQDGNDVINMPVVYKKRFGYVPLLLVNAAYVIDGKARTPGLFQTEGERLPEMTRLLTHCRDNQRLRKADIHSVVKAFKDYLVSLSEPLLTSELYQIMMTRPPEAVSGQLIFALRDHRAANLTGFVILHFVICLFKELTSYKKYNGLDVHTIARIFVTDVIKPMEEKRNAAKQESSDQLVSTQQLSLMTSLVMHLIKNEHVFKLAKILDENSVAPPHKASASSDTLLMDDTRGVRTTQEVAKTLADLHAKMRRQMETRNPLEAGPSCSLYKPPDVQDSLTTADQQGKGIRSMKSTTADWHKQGLESKRSDFLERANKPGSEDSQGTGCPQKENTVGVGTSNYPACTSLDLGEASQDRKAEKISKKKVTKDKAKKSSKHSKEASKGNYEMDMSRGQVQEFNPLFSEQDNASLGTAGASPAPHVCSSSAEGQEAAGPDLIDVLFSELYENYRTNAIRKLEQRAETRFSVCEDRKKPTKKSKSLLRQDGKVIRKTKTSGEATSDVESSLSMKITARRETSPSEIQLIYTWKKKAGSSRTAHEWEQAAHTLANVVPSLIEQTLLSMQRAQQHHAQVKLSSDPSQGNDTLVLRRGQANKKKKNAKPLCKQLSSDAGSDNEAAQDADAYSEINLSSLAADDLSISVSGKAELLSANADGRNADTIKMSGQRGKVGESDTNGGGSSLAKALRQADSYEPAAESKQSLALRKRKVMISDDVPEDEDIDPTSCAKSLKTFSCGKTCRSSLKRSASEPRLSPEEITCSVGARTRRPTDSSTLGNFEAHSARERISVVVKKNNGICQLRTLSADEECDLTGTSNRHTIVVKVKQTRSRDSKNDEHEGEDGNEELVPVFGDSELGRIWYIALIMFASNFVLSLLGIIFSHFFHL